MSFDELEGLLSRLVRTPMKSQIKIDFDLGKKIFVLSAPIYQSGLQVPRSILSYVEARKEHSFEPYKTRFSFDENQNVRLVQEVPFQWGFQPTTRQLVLQFLEVARKCHEMLSEIAAEEKFSTLQNSKGKNNGA